MALSFAQNVLKSKRNVVLFHTWTVTPELVAQAVREKRSMDLDVCVDDQGNPYLGHSKEYHEKTYSRFFKSMPIWEAVKMLAGSQIPVIVDCKHSGAWPVVEEVVAQLGPERCLVHSFVSELRFEASRGQGEPDFLTEWSPIATFGALKKKFPSVTTTASAKWLPADVLLSEEHDRLLEQVGRLVSENGVDTICLNVRDSTFSDRSLRRFLEKEIICHVGIDGIEETKLSELHIGESDLLERTSSGDFF